MFLFMFCFFFFFFFKQKTAYEMRISYWSSDVCSSDLIIRSTWRYVEIQIPSGAPRHQGNHFLRLSNRLGSVALGVLECLVENTLNHRTDGRISCGREVLGKLTLIVTSLKHSLHLAAHLLKERSEEHTSELQSLMRISYAVFCLKKKKNIQTL